MKRIALLGGAFNPPHEGHLALARLALAHLELEELRFVPTARSPHKATPGDITDGQRLSLLRAAVADLDPRITVDPLELERGGLSYTSETLQVLRDREPEAAWILLMGSDQLPGLPRWHQAATVFALASLAVGERPDHPTVLPPDLPLRLVSRWSGAPGEVVRLPSTDLPYASSELRDDLRHNRATRGLPAPVLDAIQAENLYQ